MIKHAVMRTLLGLLYEVVLVGGVIFVVAYLNANHYLPALKGAVLILGIILFFVPFVLAFFPRSPGWVKRVQQTGIPASAEVLKNDYIAGNWSYEGPDIWIDLTVRVMPEGREPYQAKMKSRLFRSQFLKPGTVVSVKVDLSNQQRVVFGGDSILGEVRS